MSDQGENPKDAMQNKMQITCGRVQIQDVRDDTWGKPSKLVSCVHAIHPFRRRCQPSQGGRKKPPNIPQLNLVSTLLETQKHTKRLNKVYCSNTNTQCTTRQSHSRFTSACYATTRASQEKPNLREKLERQEKHQVRKFRDSNITTIVSHVVEAVQKQSFRTLVWWSRTRAIGGNPRTPQGMWRLISNVQALASCKVCVRYSIAAIANFRVAIFTMVR
jgi:hypothetical protein